MGLHGLVLLCLFLSLCFGDSGAFDILVFVLAFPLEEVDFSRWVCRGGASASASANSAAAGVEIVSCGCVDGLFVGRSRSSDVTTMAWYPWRLELGPRCLDSWRISSGVCACGWCCDGRVDRGSLCGCACGCGCCADGGY